MRHRLDADNSFNGTHFDIDASPKMHHNDYHRKQLHSKPKKGEHRTIGRDIDCHCNKNLPRLQQRMEAMRWGEQNVSPQHGSPGAPTIKNHSVTHFRGCEFLKAIQPSAISIDLTYFSMLTKTCIALVDTMVAGTI